MSYCPIICRVGSMCLCISAKFCLWELSFTSSNTLISERHLVLQEWFSCVRNRLKNNNKSRSALDPLHWTSTPRGCACPKVGVAKGRNKQMWEGETTSFDNSTSLCKGKLIVKLLHHLSSCISSRWAPCSPPRLPLIAQPQLRALGQQACSLFILALTWLTVGVRVQFTLFRFWITIWN